MQFPTNFEFKEIAISEQSFQIRVGINSENDAKLWLKEYSEITNTNWIIKDGLYNPQRLIYHKVFVCQHSKKNKRKPDSGRNSNCCATIDIKIKKVNKGTKKNDTYLCLTSPLPGIIKGTNIKHNHNINTSDALKYLRIGHEAKECFINLFEDGLGPAESIKQYENKLPIEETNIAETTANARINPTYNMVKNIFKKWQGELQHKIQVYAQDKEDLENINKGFLQFTSLLPATRLVKKHLTLINKKLAKIDNSQNATETLIQISNCLRTKKGGVIRGHPTSISRQRQCVTKGSKRIANRRPVIKIKLKTKKETTSESI